MRSLEFFFWVKFEEGLLWRPRGLSLFIPEEDAHGGLPLPTSVVNPQLWKTLCFFIFSLFSPVPVT